MARKCRGDVTAGSLVQVQHEEPLKSVQRNALYTFYYRRLVISFKCGKICYKKELFIFLCKKFLQSFQSCVIVLLNLGKENAYGTKNIK